MLSMYWQTFLIEYVRINDSVILGLRNETIGSTGLHTCTHTHAI